MTLKYLPCQMGLFLNLLDLIEVPIWERALRRHLESEGQTGG